MSEERVSFFIDGSNLYHALKSQDWPKQIDFHKLAVKLCKDRKLIRIYYYSAPRNIDDDKDAYKKQQRFFDALQKTPYLELRLGRLVKRGTTHIEKGVDVRIGVDMLKFAVSDAYDTAVLMSGDGDLAHAVDAVKDQGKHVENVAVKGSASAELQRVCDVFSMLTGEFLSDCLLAMPSGAKVKTISKSP